MPIPSRRLPKPAEGSNCPAHGDGSGWEHFSKSRVTLTVNSYQTSFSCFHTCGCAIIPSVFAFRVTRHHICASSWRCSCERRNIGVGSANEAQVHTTTAKGRSILSLLWPARPRHEHHDTDKGQRGHQTNTQRRPTPDRFHAPSRTDSSSRALDQGDLEYHISGRHSHAPCAHQMAAQEDRG